MGYLGYVLADAMMYDPGEVIFEAGSDFTPQGSTGYLTEIAASRRVDFLSVDSFAEGIDAVEFFDRTMWDPGHAIKFAHVNDGFWPYRDLSPQQLNDLTQKYEAIGRPLPTERDLSYHHLILAQQVYRRAAPDSVIVFGDSWIEQGEVIGKAREAAPWLIGHHWNRLSQHTDSRPGWMGGRASYIALRRSPQW